MYDNYIKSGRTNQKLETRSKILVGAKYFINNGITFTLEDVAKKSGVSRATIYRYYSNVEILAAEAGLDISTKKPETIIQKVKGKKIEDQILDIQKYYNKLSISNENAFRKYLSIVVTSDASELRRGARRKKTLELAFKNSTVNEKDRENLVNFLTILMGIEPLIVAKDVSGLTNKQSMELMEWGMKLVLKGYFNS